MANRLSTLFHSPSSLDEILDCVFSTIDAAVIVADDQRDIVWVNHAALELFGYSEGELLGQSTAKLYFEPQGFALQGERHFNQYASPSESLDARHVHYLRKDGRCFVGETLGGPIKEAAKNSIFYLGIIKDITRRLATEEALNRLHHITSNRELDFEQRVQQILRLGAELFQLPIGIFSCIEGDVYEVMQAIHPDNALAPGMTFSLAETYCVHTLKAKGPVGFHHAGSSEIHDHPCYKNFALEAYLGSPIIVDGKIYGTLNFSSPVPCQSFTRQDIELVRLFAQWLGHEIARNNDLKALQQAQEALRLQAVTDALTGCYNRRYMQQRLQQELDRFQRYPGQLSLALLDFDHFKRLNDQHGHVAGDKALQLFVSLAQQSLRTSDIVARWGGEEFLIIFPETSVVEAYKVLQRLQKHLFETPVCTQEASITLTVSVGLVAARKEESIEAWVQRADDAMYQAKHAGRNQIVQA